MIDYFLTLPSLFRDYESRQLKKKTSETQNTGGVLTKRTVILRLSRSTFVALMCGFMKITSNSHKVFNFPHTLKRNSIILLVTFLKKLTIHFEFLP